MYKSDTIAAISTGMTASGIGIVRMSGEDAFSIASGVFTTPSGNRINSFESHRAYYGFISDGEIQYDEVILIAYKSPRSYTGENTVEINCHGGIFIMRSILDLLIRSGARYAEPGEFSKRAFLNGRLDLSSAEAVIDLINSKNTPSVSNSLKQLSGVLFEKVKALRSGIVYEIAHIEAALDDPEHISLDGYQNELESKMNTVLSELKELSSSFYDGKVLSEGIDAVIVGKPNVGKSSLLNFLLGEDRAIVTDIAGTTRDVLSEQALIGDVIINFSDTAGIRDTDDVIEKIGVEKSKEYADKADLIIDVIDSSQDLSKEDTEILNMYLDRDMVILLNKNDLKQAVDISSIKKITDKPVFEISVKNNRGLSDFKQFIKDKYLNYDYGSKNDIFVSNSRHKYLIDSAIESVENVLESINNQMSEDFYSIDLQDAYDSLGEIIGEEVSDDIVNEIFSKFCMGK